MEEPKKPQKPAWQTAPMEDRDDNKNFYDQFDRESPLFHAGNDTPVPYGEGIQKLPETMPTEFPEGFDPAEAAKPDPANSDPRVIDLTASMSAFREYKKLWAKVADAFVTRGQILEKTGKTDQEYVNNKIRAEIAIAEEFANQHAENKEFTGFEDQRKKLFAYIEGIGKDQKKGKEDIKPEITTFTRLIFKLQNQMMANIKTRKKEIKAEEDKKAEQKEADQ